LLSFPVQCCMNFKQALAFKHTVPAASKTLSCMSSQLPVLRAAPHQARLPPPRAATASTLVSQAPTEHGRARRRRLQAGQRASCRLTMSRTPAAARAAGRPCASRLSCHGRAMASTPGVTQLACRPAKARSAAGCAAGSSSGHDAPPARSLSGPEPTGRSGRCCPQHCVAGRWQRSGGPGRLGPTAKRGSRGSAQLVNAGRLKAGAVLGAPPRCIAKQREQGGSAWRRAARRMACRPARYTPVRPERRAPSQKHCRRSRALDAADAAKLLACAQFAGAHAQRMHARPAGSERVQAAPTWR